VEEEKDLLVVAMAMQSDRAERVEQMKVHVVDAEELLAPRPVGLAGERVEHPWLDRASQLAGAGEAAVVGEEVAILEQSHAAMRAAAPARPLERIPAAHDHVELVLIIRAS